MGLASFFGIGRGKMNLHLNKLQFMAGETISGKVCLGLKKSITAKELSVTLIAEQTVTSYSGGKKHVTTKTVFNFKQPIVGERDYPVGESYFDFSLLIPKNIGGFTMPEGTLGNFARVAQALSSQKNIVKWYVIARLDIAKAIDMTKKLQVNIQ